MKIKAKERWPRWMGIRGFYFVYHGSWSDPEIVWHNHAMNIHDVEDPMWDVYVETCKEEGSCDSLEDADDFVWFCNVDEINGKKCVSFSTSLNPFPFAVGYMTKTGKPRIKWN